METSNKYRINLNTLIYDLKTYKKKPIKNYENNLKLRNFSSSDLLFQQDEGQKSLSLIEWNLLTSRPFDIKFVHFDCRNRDN
jgi:hypothetical protein